VSFYLYLFSTNLFTEIVYAVYTNLYTERYVAKRVRQN